MEEVLDYIVKSLVSQPDKVVVTKSEVDGTITLSLKVDPQDMGIIIGKSGQTIKAIRKLLIVRAMAEGPQTRVNLILEDTPEGKPPVVDDGDAK